ncbi:PQQ-dependent sugar dehydrogenase [Demequina sp. SO4-18]|uniref:PQQ-dependent sugar dehydrogenase n=1 Tax=Demequina sp. SO4-18 TaxID=3401026 RepID=UPI003B599803
MLLVAALGSVVLVASPPSAMADTEPLSLEGFSDEAVLTTGISEPISMEFLPDGRMLVLQKGGQIKIGNPATVPMATEVYLTLTDLDNNAERGLIDIAIDPNFTSNGYVYLYYHPKSAGKGRIARFTHVENTGETSSRADAGSEFVVWQDTTGYTSCCHYGGGLDFGPDGNIWLTLGDQFNPDRAQDLTDASGSIIRVEPDGGVPPDNPFADGAVGQHPYIWAYGLRNPFRASWDVATNRFFIGEVGGNDIPESWEDLHVAKYDDAYKGLNYQWPGCEGPFPYSDFPECPIADGDLAEPIFAYPHTGGGTGNASLTGGVVYRGNQFPAAWNGVYFYGDYTRHFIRYLRFDESGETVTGDFPFMPSGQMPGGATTVVSIEQGPDGALYYALIATGQIRRVVYEGGNQAPTITMAQGDVTSGTAPLTVAFSATATDPENDPLEYTWHFGDGSTASGAAVEHTYTAEGPYDAYVSVSDASHAKTSEPIRIQVGTVPDVTITSPSADALFRAGDTIQVAGQATDDDPLADADFAWTVQFGHDNHFHPADLIPNGTSGEFAVPTSGHDYSNETWYRITLTVTDADGLVGTDTVEIYPDKVNFTLATEPAGLVVNLDSVPHATPWVHDTLIGFEHTVTARSPQCLGGDSYVFDSWSDGGAATHGYTVPEADSTLTAVFVPNGLCSSPVTEGLVMRLQGDQGVSGSGGNVTGWTDLSDSGNSLGLVSGSPTVVTGALNGHNVVSFDGEDDGLGRTGFNDLPTGNADRSVFAVVKYDGASPAGGWAGFTYGSTYPNQSWGPVRTSDGDLGIQGWGGGNDFDSNARADGEGWLVQSIVKSGDGFVHYKDGTEIDSGSHAHNTGTGVIRLGTELNGVRKVDMDVAEVLVYDRAVSETERAQIEAYFEQQYLQGGSTPPVPPTAAITAPAPGATVRSADVQVSWSVGGDLAPGDHVHLSLDGGEHVTLSGAEGSHTFADVADGNHSVEMQIARADHTVYTHPGSTDTVAFTVDTAPPSGDLPLAGLVLHLESDLNVISSGAGGVGGWLDQSGRGNDLDVASGAPTIGAATTPSGVAAISFDGADDSLRRNGALNGIPTGEDARTVFLVTDYQSNGWGGFSWGAPYCDMTFGTTVSGDGDLAVQGWCGDHDSNVDGNGAGWLVQSVVYDSTTFTHYADGIEIDSGTHRFNTSGDRMILGAEIDGTPYVDMDVAAVLVYNRALGAAEHDEVSSYLDQKYFSGAVEPVAPSVPQGLDAAAGDGAVTLSWTASTDANGDLAGYRIYRSETAGTIDPATDTPIATVATPGYVDDTVTNGTEYFYVVTAVDDADNESAGSPEVWAMPEVVEDVAPSVPQDLEATAGDSTVELSWTASTDINGNLAGYRIYRSETAGTIDPATDAPIATVAEPGYIDDTVTNDVEYFYVVTAIDDADNQSAPSAEAAATPAPPLPDTTPPAAPTGLDAAAGDGAVALTWDDQSEPDLAGYRIYRSETTGTIDPTTDTPIAIVTTPGHTDDTVTNDVEYFYAVTAIDDAGNQSAASAEAAATPAPTPDGCAAPSGASAVLCLESDTGLTGTTPVTAWSDMSGHGNDLTATGGPTRTTTPSGMPAVSFDGVDDSMRRDGSLNGIPTGGAARTVFFVTQYRSNGWGGFSWGAPYCGMTFGTTVSGDGDLAVQGWCGDHDSNVDGNGAGWLVQSVVYDSTTFTHYADGIEIDSGTHSFNTSGDRMILGAEIDGTPYIDMDVAAALVYDRALGAAEHAAVSSYLSQKYLSGAEEDAAPSAPGDLVSTGDDGKVTLSWTASSDANGDLAGYRIYRSETAGTIDPATDTPIATVAEPGHTDDTVTNDVEYFYLVTAIDDAGNQSAPSAEVSATPQAPAPPEPDTTPPAAPTGLNATSGDGTVALTWDDQAEPDLAGYRIYRSETAGTIDPATDTPIATVAEPGHTDDTVTNDVEYFYLVTAIDDAGNQSAPSAEVSATPQAPAPPEPDTTPPAAPTGLDAAADDGTVALTWDDQAEPDLAGYRIYRSETTGTIDPATDTPIATVATPGYVDDTVTNDVEYFYVVTAIDDADNESAASQETSATPAAAPAGCAAPSGASAALCLESDTGLTGTSPVTAWSDMSGHGNDLTAVGGPTRTTTPSGMPAVSFDGVDDALIRDGSLHEIPRGDAARTVFVVTQYRSNGWGGFSWGAPYCGMTFGTTVSSDGDLAIQGWCGDHDSNVDGNGAGWLVQSVVYDSTTFTHYANGTEIDSGTHSFNTSGDRMILGAEIDGTPYIDMDIAAALVFDRALTTAEHQAVISYLQAKYL